MKITQTALRFRTSVYVLLLLIAIVGVDAYRTLPLEAAPDIEIPIVVVSTLYPGVAPAEMETLVTNVLERELKDLKDVKEMRSSSAESISSVTIEFETGVDMDDAYQQVRDRVDKAKPDLPPDAEDPVLTEINISDFPMMLVNVFGPLSLVELKRLGEDLEQQIEAVPGVLNVDVTGGLEREIHVLLNPERLEYYELGVGQVIGRIQQEHMNMPGGNVELGRSKYLVRVSGEFKDVSRMEDIVLKSPEGRPVKLSDVGRVVDGFAEQETLSRVNGQDCVTLRIQKRSGANIVEIADQIRALLAAAEPKLPPGVKLLPQQDQSEYIRDTVSDLENSVISGMILVIVVLFLFMGLRNALFVAVAIPLSFLITVAALAAMGVTLNMVVLFSLIIALGMLVDNSIVVVENVYRHRCEGLSRARAAYEGTREVAWPIIASTATTVAAFAPLLFWPGIMGGFMSYLPQTVITALLASLFVALVVNPVLAATFQRRGPSNFDESGEVRSGLLRVYKRALGFSLRFPLIMLAAAVLSLVGVIALYAEFGTGVEFFPATTPERAQASVKAPLGNQLAYTDEMARRVEALVSGDPNTQDVVTNVGTAGGFSIGVGGGQSHRAVVDLEFKDRHQRTAPPMETIVRLREQLAELSGAAFRIDVEKMGPPTGAPVDVRISGPDYAELARLARAARELLATVPGVVDLKDDYDSGSPELRVNIDREKAMLRRLDTATIAQAVRTAINGTKAGVLHAGEDEFDIVVRYERDFRSSIQDLLDLRVTGRDDVQIPLRDVATVATAGGLGSINHVDRQRTVRVTSDVAEGRSSSEVLPDVARLLQAELPMPPGYRIRYGGESEEQEKATAFLGRAFLIGILVMAMILITQFNSVARPLIILASILMSLIGVLAGLLFSGFVGLSSGKFGIMMTGMGVISLAGVVVNNAIVLIDYINQLRDTEGLGLDEALLRAGVVRFRPVMMTAITTVLGMLPMALGWSIDFRSLSFDVGAPSTEWWGPMAQAIVFGLLFATLMTLIMVPVMYQLQVRATAWLAALLRRVGLLRGGDDDDDQRPSPGDEEPDATPGAEPRPGGAAGPLTAGDSAEPLASPASEVVR